MPCLCSAPSCSRRSTSSSGGRTSGSRARRCAINKTALLDHHLVGADRLSSSSAAAARRSCVPGGMQNVVEMTYEFVDNGITKDVVGHDAGALHAVPRHALLLHPLPQHLGDHPGRPVPADRADRHPGVPGAAWSTSSTWSSGSSTTGIKYLTGHLVPAGRAEGALRPRDADRVRADLPRAALLAGRPTPRQHAGRPHPAHRARRCSPRRCAATKRHRRHRCRSRSRCSSR